MKEIKFNIEVKGSKGIITPVETGGYSTLAGLQERYDSLCKKLVIDGIYIGSSEGEKFTHFDELKSEAELNQRFHDLGFIGGSSTSEAEKQQNVLSKEQKELIVVSLVIIFSSMFLITFGGYKLFEPIGLRFSSMANYDGDPITVRYEVSYSIGMIFSLIIGSYIGLFYFQVNADSPLKQYPLSKKIAFFSFNLVFILVLIYMYSQMIFLSDSGGSKKIDFMFFQSNFFSLSHLMLAVSCLIALIVISLRHFIYILMGIRRQ